jgi:hypothetical protein
MLLLRAPDSWPQPVVATVAMILLAILDLAGAFAAKEAVERRSLGLALLGAGLFVAVFWVFMSSLRVAELAAVTFGWVVILQVGVVLLDRFRYGVIPAPGTWLAIVVLLVAQAYLILAPGSKPAEPVAAGPESSVTAAPVGGSAEDRDQPVETAQHEVTELGDGERPDRDRAYQQRLADGLVPRVVHVPPGNPPVPARPFPPR